MQFDTIITGGTVVDGTGPLPAAPTSASSTAASSPIEPDLDGIGRRHR